MKALWSYEPFHQDKKRIQLMNRALGALIGSPSSIEVGFIATHTESSLNLAFDIPEDRRFSTYPRNQIKKELKGAKIKIDEKKIHVIDYPTHSNTKAVDRLFKLARDRSVDLIGIYTHSRKGYLRFVLGSFAETAIHRSRTDLLVLNPKVKISAGIKNVLFASDFGPSSKKEFLKLFKYVKNLNSNLTVFHHAEAIYKWSIDETNPKIRSYRKKVDQMRKWIEEQCTKAGIKLTTVVVSDFTPTSNHILKLSKKNKMDMVVVCAKIGPMAALMGGSITRQIVRESSIPVLILKL